MRRSRAVTLVAGLSAAFDANAHGGLTGGELFAILVVPMTGILCALAAPLFVMTEEVGKRIAFGIGFATLDFILWVLVIAIIGSIGESLHPFQPPWFGSFTLFVIAAFPYALPAIYVFEMRRRKRKIAS